MIKVVAHFTYIPWLNLLMWDSLLMCDIPNHRPFTWFSYQGAMPVSRAHTCNLLHKNCTSLYTESPCHPLCARIICFFRSCPWCFFIVSSKISPMPSSHTGNKCVRCSCSTISLCYFTELFHGVHHSRPWRTIDSDITCWGESKRKPSRTKAITTRPSEVTS